jgi:uncharacterized protein (TIGR02391 family)
LSEWPTVEEANELPVDEFALRILRYFETLDVEHPAISRRGIGNKGSWVDKSADRDAALSASRRATEAWDWLVHHGLAAPRQEATSPYQEPGYITPRGRAVLADADGLATMRAEDRLGVDLHARLEHRIRRQFLLREYELAAFAAMREVEIRVRELGGYAESIVGVDLMRMAFNPNEATLGPLADLEQITAEREGTGHLFAGAIAVFKNPSSHRQVDFDDPTVASEIVLLADLLLRMLDGVERRRAKGT